MKMFLSLALTLASFTSMASTFNCGGTEPFWNAEISEKFIRYNDPVIEERMSLKILSKQNAAGFAEDAAFVVKTKYASAAVALGECSDGMSDQDYSHTIVLEINGSVLAGCCNKVK